MEDTPKTSLAQWMAANGLTDESVAAEVVARGGKVSRSQLNRMRNGASRPSFDNAAILEAITGIPAGQLFRPPHDMAA